MSDLVTCEIVLGSRPVMVFADIEKLKQKYTDQYVVVDGQRPELARFRDLVGQVKTVNMSGRALVEFADYNVNIGWFDIDLDFLKVVDKPLPKAEKPEGKKPTVKADAKPAVATAKPKPAPAAAKPGAGKSTADILAAARGGAAPAKPAGAKPSTADVLAAARGGVAKAPTAAAPAKEPAALTKRPAAAPAKVDRSKMSVADMLAAARAGGSAGATAAQTPAAAAPVEAPSIEEAAAAPVTETPTAPAPAAAKTSERVDKSKMTVDEIIAWCREHDAK